MNTQLNNKKNKGQLNHNKRTKQCWLLLAGLLLGLPAYAANLAPIGRIHWDAAYDHEANAEDKRYDSEIRRFQLGVKGKAGTLDFLVMADLSGLEDKFNREALQIDDLWLRKRFSVGALTVGQFKHLFSLEGRTSSNVGTFLERPALISTFIPGYRKGVGWLMSNAHSSFSANVWKLRRIDAPKLAGHGIGTHVSFAPRAQDRDVHHFGLSLIHERHQHPGADGVAALRIRPRGGSYLTTMRPTLANFSGGRDTDVDKWSLDYARVQGAWSWQGELTGGRFDNGREDAQLMSGYGAVSWFVTGHSRSYDVNGARFVRVRGIAAGSPAWELALRAERLHGHQRDERGMDRLDVYSTIVTFASNWYVRDNLRLMLNLIAANESDHLTGARRHNHELAGRFHYDF